MNQSTQDAVVKSFYKARNRRRSLVDHRITYSVRKTFAAPLPAVYDWCTDFRDDDPEIAKSTATRHIVEKGADRVIWIGTSLRGGERRAGVSIVTLLPPD